MSTPSHCPHCGGDLRDDTPAVQAAAPATTRKWEDLREVVKPPRSIAEMLAQPAERGPTWWLPSLVYLAYRTATTAKARAVLDEFASRRDELSYAVIEEQTDDVVGFTVQPWPLVDERGRLRFPISVDPTEIEVRANDLARLVQAARDRWSKHKLLPDELVGRQVHIGDVFAVAFADEPSDTRIPTLAHDRRRGPRYVGGLDKRKARGSLAVPVLDITWDAREAGKLAHYAAVAGVVPDELGAAAPAVAAVARETEARYREGFEKGIHPRDIPPRARTQ